LVIKDWSLKDKDKDYITGCCEVFRQTRRPPPLSLSSAQASSDRDCPMCLQCHLSNIFKLSIPNPKPLNPNPITDPNLTLKLKEKKTTPE